MEAVGNAGSRQWRVARGTRRAAPVGYIARELGLMDDLDVLAVLNRQRATGELFCEAATALQWLSPDAARLVLEEQRARRSEELRVEPG